MLQNLLNKTLGMMMLLCVAFPAWANQESQPLANDPRIRTYTYEPNEVYIYTGHYKFASIIQLDPTENIDSISMGDPTGWQIVTSGSRLFMKPIEQNATTNMTVMTDKRIYFFELYAEQAEEIRDEEITFLVTFVYPDDTGNSAGFKEFELDEALLPENKKKAEQELAAAEKDNPRKTVIPNTEIEPELYNYNYSVTGSRLIAPLKVFDDGEFTYMEFRRMNASIPAVFSVDKNGNEALINFRATDNYIIIEQVEKQFTLRNGTEVTCLFNESDPLKREDEYAQEALAKNDGGWFSGWF